MNAARWWLAPLHAAALLTGAKSFGDNQLIGSARLNRHGLHERRVALAHRLAARRRAAIAPALDADERARFDRDGFVLRSPALPPAAFAALRAEIEALRAPAREMVQGDTITRRIPLDPALLARLPATRAWLRSPGYAALLDYAGASRAAPAHYVQTILSQVHDAPPDPQTALHADTFHPSVKAWLFLRDVPADEGPFVYVPGSHRADAARLAWERARSIAASEGGLDRLSRRGSLRIAPEELAALGCPPPVSFAVPANTLVVADTFGFHARGPSVRPSIRVELWSYARRNPFLPWSGFDPWRLPVLRDRKVGLILALEDALERRGLRRATWRAVGLRAPGDPAGGRE
jgi:hypothetical protein